MINVTNSNVQEYRTAPCTEEITNSFVLKRVDDGYGNSAVAIATGAAGEDIVGIAHATPSAAIEKPVVGEKVTLDAERKATLEHVAVTGTAYVYNVTKGAVVTDATITGREIQITGSGEPAEFSSEEGDVLTVNYRRSVTMAELTDAGLPLDFANRMQGLGTSIEFATGNSTVDTDLFDTAAAYSVGAKLYVSGGIPTTEAPSAESPVIGRVSSVPTAGYPVLGVSGIWNF